MLVIHSEEDRETTDPEHLPGMPIPIQKQKAATTVWYYFFAGCFHETLAEIMQRPPLLHCSNKFFYGPLASTSGKSLLSSSNNK